ncbi:hypothetical protein SAMN04487880_1846 [Marinobacter sp. es.042]|uniref:hypothetical protein n=1 Tax=Marinobacter sp. es.042 TaxID=1761794 RepID=UPI000B6196D3|nr:hypothetical protein [Marinobacter sp. es.042]SNB56922.1 hypothetical protein SAMN04487880_1846 [Marinobacter sp. es.042]
MRALFFLVLILNVGFSFASECEEDSVFSRKESEIDSMLRGGISEEEAEFFQAEWEKYLHIRCKSIAFRSYRIKVADSLFQASDNGLIDEKEEIFYFALEQIKYRDSSYKNLLFLLARFESEEVINVFRKEIGEDRFFRFAATAAATSCNEKLIKNIDHYVKSLPIEKQKFYLGVRERFSQFDIDSGYCD